MQKLHERTAIVAFDGWNDAGEAASLSAQHVLDHGDFVELWALDSEPYFDYQYTRPTVSLGDDGKRKISWPTVTVHKPTHASAPYLVLGTEPARRWQSFVAELVPVLVQEGIRNVVMLGSMLADAPHTRDITVTLSSESSALRQQFACERSQYEGPVGVLSVLGAAVDTAGLQSMSLWAHVPHYTPPHAQVPKAALALVSKLSEIVAVPDASEELRTASRRWEASMDAAVADDEDMMTYIRQLEQARDAIDSPEASGESIAQEFQRFLRHDGGADETKGPNQ